MHLAFVHLAKRVGQARGTVAEVVAEVESQSERETRTLEQAEYGDEFDEELAPIQEQVVGALQETLERLDDALRALDDAERTLQDVNRL